MSKRLIALGVGIIALGIVFLSSIFTVKEAEQAIVLELGRFVRLESKPGLHFKVPFIQNVSYFDRRVLDFEADLGEINTSDQKQTLVDTYTRYRITDALKFFQTARSIENFEARRDDAPLNAIIKSNVRQVISRVDLATLLTAKRAEVMKDITKRVHTEMERFGVEVIDVRLKRIDLPQQNADAVQQRMETQRRQEAIRIRAEAEQKANILRGEGEGTAQEIFNRAFGQDKDFFEFWQCMQTVRDGLANGTRLVGTPSSELLFQLCRNPQPGSAPAEPRRAENQ